MAISWPSFKDPDEVLDYQIDWSARLVTMDSVDTITTSTWTVPDGITKNSDGKSNTATTIWLSGGVKDTAYILTNRIVTAGGRSMDQSVKLKIKAK